MGIPINGTDITDAATELSLELADPEKVEILKASESCDIQAAPGSGKTTIITAKLALLAKKWPWANRGVLVLSHTNVARHEIESRLSQSKSLRQLLGYPHFIGTFQAFVDQFLALPYLRQQQVEVIAIDDDKFSNRALAAFKKGPYWSARAALKRRSEPLSDVVGKLRFDGSQLAITHPAIHNTKFPSSSSKTGQELENLKRRLAKDGYFRFEDMYAFGETCLAKRPYLISLLRQRFPWVFVDELQDTNEGQDRIIEALFGGGESVLQRYGDKNQAIFDFADSAAKSPELFGRRKTLPLSSTHRFGKQIAHFATKLTVAVPQTLKGLPDKPDHCHTVFIFTRDKALAVPIEFANLVLAEVPAGIRAKRDVCVVGSRKNVRNGNATNFPLSIGDYWRGFQSDLSTTPQVPDSLLGFIVQARDDQLKELSFADVISKIAGGLLEIVRRSANSGQAVVNSRTALLDSLRQLGNWTGLKTQLWDLLRPDTVLTESRWNAATAEIIGLLGPLLKKVGTADVQTFLKWTPALQPVARDPTNTAPNSENIFLHKTETDSVRLRFDSIHGVKGETHAATLVVETYMNRSHDMKTLLPVLCGNKPATSLNGTAVGHCKRIFVGITRPSELVCLAIFAEHLKPADAKQLEQMGWRLKYLS